MRERLDSMTAEERRQLTKRARAAYVEQIAAKVDPNGKLTAEELDAAVAEYRRQELRRHSKRSAAVRRERAENAKAARLEALRARAEAEAS